MIAILVLVMILLTGCTNEKPSDEYVNSNYTNNEKINSDNQDVGFHGLVSTPAEVSEFVTNFIIQAGTMGEPLSAESCELVFNQQNNFREESLDSVRRMVAQNSPTADTLELSPTQDIVSSDHLTTFQINDLIISRDAVLFYENTDERFYEVRVDLISTEYVARMVIEFVHFELEEGQIYCGVWHEDSGYDECYELFKDVISESRFNLGRIDLHLDNISITVVQRNGEFFMYDATRLTNILGERFSVWDGNSGGWRGSRFQRDVENFGEVDCQ